jgi:hypothetical protein
VKSAGEYAPVQQDQLDLSAMVDCAYSMADWSTNQSSAPFPALTQGRTMHSTTSGRERDSQRAVAANLAALDSVYAALSSLGFQQVCVAAVFTTVVRCMVP